MRTRQEVIDAFTPNTKLTEVQKQIVYKVDLLIRETAIELVDLLPEHADRTVALRKLLEAKMLAIQLATHYISPVQGAASALLQPVETQTNGKPKGKKAS